MLFEFLFEALHERSEPIVAVFELVKMVCQLREYHGLLYNEKVHTYIDLEDYQELKKIKEYKESHFTLKRTKKDLPKLKEFQISEKFKEFKQQIL